MSNSKICDLLIPYIELYNKYKLYSEKLAKNKELLLKKKKKKPKKMK